MHTSAERQGYNTACVDTAGKIRVAIRLLHQTQMTDTDTFFIRLNALFLWTTIGTHTANHKLCECSKEPSADLTDSQIHCQDQRFFKQTTRVSTHHRIQHKYVDNKSTLCLTVQRRLACILRINRYISK